MFKLSKAAGASAVALALLIAVAAHWAEAGPAAAQTERQVQVPLTGKKLPVVITSVTLGDTIVQAGRFKKASPTIDPITPFQADDDWIKNLTIHLLNRTDRTIVFAKVLLIFPETGNGADRPYRIHFLNLGRMPGAIFLANGQLYSQPPDWVPLSFGTGQTLAVALGDHIDQIRSGVERVILLAAATKIKVDLNEFYFADGMRWVAGGFEDPDPLRPGKWKYKGNTYFPGNVNLNWPSRQGSIDHQ